MANVIFHFYVLAGVTIVTLTGNNGLLTKIDNAKNENSEAIAKEKIKVEVAENYGLDGRIDKTLLKNISELKISDIYLDDENNIKNSPVALSINKF